jgi:two-component system cell cycle sensor histidine kinase/response regulator CckA
MPTHTIFDNRRNMRALEVLATAIIDNIGPGLAAARSAADRLLESRKLTADERENIALIKWNTNRTATVLDLLSAFVSQQPTKLASLDIRKTLSELTSLLKRLLGEAVKLEMTCVPDLWPIFADVQVFERIVLNLAANARDAMPNGGTLCLDAKNMTAAECKMFCDNAIPAADFIVIDVTDTGNGISDDAIERIFEPFFSTKSGRGNGTGW